MVRIYFTKYIVASKGKKSLKKKRLKIPYIVWDKTYSIQYKIY